MTTVPTAPPPAGRSANGRRTSGSAATSSPGGGCSSAIGFACTGRSGTSPRRITVVSVGHTVLRLAPDGRLRPADSSGRRSNTRRSSSSATGGPGTTLLHELLIRDPRHAFPTTYECLVPHHFLMTESWLPKLLWWMMPSRRPMDNMPAGWDRPQEDEFALCLLGQPSPYERIAFPNRQEGDVRLTCAVYRREPRVGRRRFCGSSAS